MIDKLKSLIVLFKAHQSLEKNIKISLKDTEFSVNEFTVMEALYTKRELYTHEIIASILIPNSSITYVLDALEKKGILNRKKDPSDKRKQILSLTDKGREIFIKIYEMHYDHMKSIFSVLDQDEEEELIRLLKKLGKKAQEVSNYES